MQNIRHREVRVYVSFYLQYSHNNKNNKHINLGKQYSKAFKEASQIEGMKYFSLLKRLLFSMS